MPVTLATFGGGFLQKRLPQTIGSTHKITRYDLDNLYPNRMEELMLRSPLVKSAVNVLADFINGDGFTENGDLVMTDQGLTANDLLALASLDYATFNGFSFHLGFDGLGNAVEVQSVQFPFVRYGEPDQLGKHHDVKVSNNWEGAHNKLPQGSMIEPLVFPLFNPLTAAEETIVGGNGQVLYFTGKPDQYPLATFDAIADTAQSDEEVQVFELANLQNGFLSTTIFKYPGKFESDEERIAFQKQINNLKGSHNANSIIVAETDEDQTNDLIETIPALNNDSLFNLTRQSIVDRVLQNYAVPPALMGVNPQGGVFTQQAYKDAFIIYNVLTKSRRRAVERVFKSFGDLMGISFGTIIPNQFEEEKATEEVVVETTTETEEIEETTTDDGTND